MELIEFKTFDPNENEYIIFINPVNIESVYIIPEKGRVEMQLVSGTLIKVNHTLDEIKEKLGIPKKGGEIKRTAGRIT